MTYDDTKDRRKQRKLLEIDIGYATSKISSETIS